MRTMTPLAQSHAADGLEAEYKRLFVSMLQRLSDGIDAVNCYGMPHLGNHDLLVRYLISQGLSNFAVSRMSEDDLRYLAMAWRFKNPKRGTHFLSAYLRAVWGTDFEIHPLYQKKNAQYPKVLKTEAEIIEQKERVSDYWLTSRLKIILNGNSGYIDKLVAESLNRALPARLFVDEISKNINGETVIYMASGAWLESFVEQDLKDTIDDTALEAEQGFADTAEFFSIIMQDI